MEAHLVTKRKSAQPTGTECARTTEPTRGASRDRPRSGWPLRERESLEGLGEESLELAFAGAGAAGTGDTVPLVLLADLRVDGSRVVRRPAILARLPRPRLCAGAALAAPSPTRRRRRGGQLVGRRPRRRRGGAAPGERVLLLRVV